MARKFKVVVNGKEYIVEVEELRESKSKRPKVERVDLNVSTERVEKIEVEDKKTEEQSGEKVIRAPMAGIVMEVYVDVGQEVKVGDRILTFEAMKMENELLSEFSGRVKEIKVKEGDNVETGQVIVVLE